MPQFPRTLLEVLKSVTLYFNAIYCSFKACSTCEFACLSSMMLEMKLSMLLLKVYLLYCFYYTI